MKNETSEQSREREALPERDTTKAAEQQGIFRKFEVRRTDGSSEPGGKHEHCEYFVLDVDHDPHAKAALAAYAKSVWSTHPALYADMRERYDLSNLIRSTLSGNDAESGEATDAALQDAIGCARKACHGHYGTESTTIKVGALCQIINALSTPAALPAQAAGDEWERLNGKQLFIACCLAKGRSQEDAQHDWENWEGDFMSQNQWNQAALYLHPSQPKPTSKGEETYQYAVNLATALWEKYWKESSPYWRPFNDTLGVLTQIDNMTSRLMHPDEAEKFADSQQRALSEGDAKDAARYRWLKAQHEIDDEQASNTNYGKNYPPRTLTVFVDDGEDGLEPLRCDPGALNEYVDAAIQAAAFGGKG